ncbi:hypothetical protein ABK040_005272 [Willaertia magna]
MSQKIDFKAFLFRSSSSASKQQKEDDSKKEDITKSSKKTTVTIKRKRKDSTLVESKKLKENLEEEKELSREEIENSKSLIHKIDNSSIHRICSGQVIVSLSSVIKELIENSIDAKSTSIDIKFVNMGFESIEVIDNGAGISQDNFENVVKKHYTSKITTFDDIQFINSFGFRGEALSSICCVSELVIITKTKEDDMATKLTFNFENQLISKEEVTRNRSGTTIRASNLFKNFPVRFREFERNLKKEFTKCVSMIQSYALSSEGITFSCSNKSSSGNDKAQQILMTHGKSLKDNIINIFSVKQYNKLMPVEFVNSGDLKIKVTGYISKVDKGFGRSSSDRQFLYVNKRPVDLNKICKSINEIYREHNIHQYPVFILNIELEPNTYDVNVTPDKRKIYLQIESNVIKFIREELCVLFGSRTFTPNSNSIEPFLSISSQENSQKVEPTTPKSSSLHTDNLEKVFDQEDENNEDENNIKKVSPTISSPKLSSKEKESKRKLYDLLKDNLENEDEKPTRNITTKKIISRETTEPQFKLLKKVNKTNSCEDCEDFGDCNCNNNVNEETKIEEESIEIVYDTEIQRGNVEPSLNIGFNENEIINMYSKVKQLSSPKISKLTKFKTNLLKHSKEECEKELTRTLNKEEFKKMEVIGQFNKSFIIGQLNDDLFILDQHACDEKYNYENLLEKTKFNVQPLVVPKTLDLSISERLLVIDNMEVFEKNGFRVKIDEGSNNLLLSSLPHSKNITFTEDDFVELISQLSDCPECLKTTLRPTKISKIIASRACRSSVMFGQPLSRKEMCKVVNNLSTLNVSIT